MLISTTCGPLQHRVGTEKSLEIIKNAGFDAADMSLCPMSKPECVFNGEDYKERAKALRAYADSIGLKFNQSHLAFSFKWDSEDFYERVFMPTQTKGLEISGILGIDTVVVHPLHHGLYRGHEEEWFEKNMAFYRSLLPLAKEYNLRICLENMWQRDPKRKYIVDDTCSRAEEFIRYLDTLNDEHFVACLDLGHCGLVGTEAPDMIRALGHDRLKALHVHDNDYISDTHQLPGICNMDFEPIMQALAEIDYDGYFTYEADAFHKKFPEGFLPQATEFMVTLGRYYADRFDFYRSQK